MVESTVFFPDEETKDRLFVANFGTTAILVTLVVEFYCGSRVGFQFAFLVQAHVELV